MSFEELLTPTMTKSKGIQGVIKQKPEDFIVGEMVEENCILDPRMNDFNLPGNKGLFVHFVLVKKDIDSASALDWVARLWKVPRNDFSIAGMKDRRAFTAQRVSVWGVKNRFETNLLKEIKLPKIETKGLCLRINENRLGKLWGNSFEITIRDINLNIDETTGLIEESLAEIKDQKLILNGFGIQRFGEYRPITHSVGKQLLLGNAREAVRVYIGKTFENDEEEARKKYWKTENIQETLELLPSSLNIEKKMLLELRKNKNYEQVFLSLPLQFQKIFIHAYQSFLFNKYLVIRYNEYSSDLHEPIDGEKTVDNRIFAPIIGSKTKLTGQVKDIYTRIMGENDIVFENFQTNFSKKLGSKGTFRSIAMEPIELKLVDISDDNLNKGKTKVTVSFKLRRGSYATEILRHIMI